MGRTEHTDRQLCSFKDLKNRFQTAFTVAHMDVQHAGFAAQHTADTGFCCQAGISCVLGIDER